MTHIQELIQKCIAQIIQQNPIVKNIFEKIAESGGRILIVGGIVRDTLLQKTWSDFDFEVYHLSFDQLQQILAQFGPVSFVGKSFGVLRLHTLDADWSIPRKDSSGRKPKVDLDPNMSFVDAFKRRDLTVNAMGIDVLSGELIDPYGGLYDLEHKVLRAPDVSFFVQDPLRLFRVMQFMARLHMKPDAQLNAVCRTMDISTISTERIDEEFKKLFLKSDRPSLGISWLKEIGRFEEIFPELSYEKMNLKALDCLAKNTMEFFSVDLKLSAMWGLFSCALKNISLPKNSNQFGSKQDLLSFKSFIKKYVHALEIVDDGAMIAWYVDYIPLLKEQRDYKWLAYWIAHACNLETLAVIGSCLFEQSMIDEFVKRAKLAGVLQKYEEPLLQGKDLLHLAQGKQLGDLVKRAYDLQLNEGIVDKKQLLEMLLK